MSLTDLASVASPVPGGLPDLGATSGAQSSSSGILDTGEFNPTFGGGAVQSQLPLFAILGVGAFVAWMAFKK